jgi:hypothetical protein
MSLRRADRTEHGLPVLHQPPGVRDEQRGGQIATPREAAASPAQTGVTISLRAGWRLEVNGPVC